MRKEEIVIGKGYMTTDRCGYCRPVAVIGRHPDKGWIVKPDLGKPFQVKSARAFVHDWPESDITPATIELILNALYAGHYDD